MGMDWGTNAMTGIVLAGAEEVRLNGDYAFSHRPALPLLYVEGTPAGKSARVFTGEVKASLNYGGEWLLRYSLDDTPPVAGSAQYTEPITLKAPGRHIVRARAFTEGRATAVTKLVLEIKEEADE